MERGREGGREGGREEETAIVLSLCIKSIRCLEGKCVCGESKEEGREEGGKQARQTTADKKDNERARQRFQGNKLATPTNHT